MTCAHEWVTYAPEYAPDHPQYGETYCRHCGFTPDEIAYDEWCQQLDEETICRGPTD